MHFESPSAKLAPTGCDFAGWATWLGLMALLLTACTAQPTQETVDPQGEFGQLVPVDGRGDYIDLSARELASLLDTDDPFLVNVHVPEAGAIPGTDAFIPYDEVEQRLDELPPVNSMIVVYCRSGGMSAIAARALVSAGFTNVYNLDGGYRAWREAGYPFDEAG